MPGRYYIKKFRKQKGQEERTPLFLVRRSYPGSKKDIWQLRYSNISLSKNFNSIESALDLVERILNNDISSLRKEDIIVNLNVNIKNKRISLETKGIFSKENLFFFEVLNGKTDFNEEVDKFVDSTVVLWKLAFMKQNELYTESLYKRKLIGFKHVN